MSPCGESKKLDLKPSLAQFLFISLKNAHISASPSYKVCLAKKGFFFERILSRDDN